METKNINLTKHEYVWLNAYLLDRFELLTERPDNPNEDYLSKLASHEVLKTIIEIETKLQKAFNEDVADDNIDSLLQEFYNWEDKNIKNEDRVW